MKNPIATKFPYKNQRNKNKAQLNHPQTKNQEIMHYTEIPKENLIKHSILSKVNTHISN